MTFWYKGYLLRRVGRGQWPHGRAQAAANTTVQGSTYCALHGGIPKSIVDVVPIPASPKHISISINYDTVLMMPLTRNLLLDNQLTIPLYASK